MLSGKKHPAFKMECCFYPAGIDGAKALRCNLQTFGSSVRSLAVCAAGDDIMSQ